MAESIKQKPSALGAPGLPDFRKLGPDPHARFVGRIFQHLSEGRGHIPHQWFADEIARERSGPAPALSAALPAPAVPVAVPPAAASRASPS